MDRRTGADQSGQLDLRFGPDGATQFCPNQPRPVYDYRTNVAQYPEWQAFLRKNQPKTLIFWGQDDIFFTRAGGEAYLRDLPKRKFISSREVTSRLKIISTLSPQP